VFTRLVQVESVGAFVNLRTEVHSAKEAERHTAHALAATKQHVKCLMRLVSCNAVLRENMDAERKAALASVQEKAARVVELEHIVLECTKYSYDDPSVVLAPHV
jgi:hypothetical protein